MEIKKLNNYTNTVRVLFGENEAEFFCRLTGSEPRDPLSILASDSLKVCGHVGGRIVSFISTWQDRMIDSAYVKIKLHRPFPVARHTRYDIRDGGLPYKADKCTDVSILIDTFGATKRIDIVLSRNTQVLKMEHWKFDSIPGEVYSTTTLMIDRVMEDSRMAKEEAWTRAKEEALARK